MNMQPETMRMTPDKHCGKCFSFKGIVVGGIVAFGLMFLFNLLTVGGGLAAFTRTEKGLETLVTMAYLWTIVGSFIIFFIAGLATSLAGHHYGDERPRNEILHGFAAWVVYILITLAFLSHASGATVSSFPQSFVTLSQTTTDSTEASATVSRAADTASKSEGNKQVATPAEQKQVHKIGLLTLAAFFVFFVEALACCFGAWCGVECHYGVGCNRTCSSKTVINK